MSDRLPHQELQLLLGAYVLGGLDAADRRLVDEHVPTCASCSAELARFSSVPALLQLATPGAVAASEPAPDSLARLVRAARARRARRNALLMAAAALAVVAAVAVSVLAVRQSQPSSPAAAPTVSAASTTPVVPPTPVAPAPTAPTAPATTGPAPADVVYVDAADRVAGQAVLDPRGWGTEVRLELTYLPAGSGPYTAWAVDKDGREEQAASWTIPPSGKCSVTGATSIQRSRLDRVEVRAEDGTPLLVTR